MKPCDCISIEEATTLLNEQGISFNETSLRVSPGVGILTMGPASLRIPMHRFKLLAKWYLEDQIKRK